MTAVNFGSGTMIGRRTGVSNPTPSFFGVLQDIQIDFDRTLKELIGNMAFAVDVAPAAMKITGKAKFATIQANAINDLFFGQTLAASSGFSMAVPETASIPATPYQVTTSHAAAFLADLGVFFALTGVQLKRVASSPITGQYSVNESTGVYTFAAADTLLSVNIYYEYTVTSMNQISISNQLMGVGPSFALFLSETYTDNSGTVNTFNMKLNACRSSKLALPFKNTDYTMLDIDFQAFADNSGNIGTIVTGA
jgi:hypothetical protein